MSTQPKANQEIPHHVLGSKVYYQNCRGTRFIYEEVYNPGELQDAAFVNKEALMNRFREIARQTMRDELVGVVDKYIKIASVMYIVSDLNHKIVGVCISSYSFENDHLVLLPWLNMYLEEYRKNGMYIVCMGKLIFLAIREYQKHKNLRGLAKVLPFFKKWYFVARTFNPLIYCSMLRSNMVVSPLIADNGMISSMYLPKNERAIRISFLKQLGHSEEELDERSLFIIKALKNEKENKEMHENIPHVPDEPVNVFFKDHLGLDQGNLLVFTASFRPAPLVMIDKIKKHTRKFKARLSKLGSLVARQPGYSNTLIK